MAKRIALILLLAGLIISSALPASAQTSGGTISGQLTNGTSGGSNVPDVNVRLDTFINAQLTGNLTAKTGSDGGFKFDNLVTGPQNAYRIVVTYQEVDYFSGLIVFGQGENSKSQNITVYDSTNDTVISIDTAHSIIVPGKNQLEITVVYDFINSSNRTFIGTGDPMANGKRKTLSFAIPADATDVQYGDGFDNLYVYPSHEGFIDTMPVLPGVREVVYAYKVPLTGGSYNFNQKLNYSAEWFNLLIQGDSIKVKSDKLTDQGPLDMGQGNQYLYYVGHNFTAGQTVSATLSGLAGPMNQKLIFVLGGVALVIIVGGALAFWKMQSRRKTQPAVKVRTGDDTEQNLLRELARLDDEFAAGRIPEQAYRQQRAQKKAILVKLMSGKRG